MRLIPRGPLRSPRVGRLAIQVGLAFAIAMIAVGMIGFSAADAWVSSRIDASLRYHTVKYLAPAQGRPVDDATVAARIIDWQHRKVLSERTYMLFARNGARLAGWEIG